MDSVQSRNKQKQILIISFISSFKWTLKVNVEKDIMT